MDQPQDFTDDPPARRRRRFLMPLRRPRWALVIWGLILLVALLAVVIWVSRVRIASDLLERELSERGVRATYRVTRIGLRTQRIEDLVLGDPANPDLTARWVELDVALGWPEPRVRLITARGVRLKGRVVEGRLRLGELDKLLPPPTGEPFRLPNQRVDIADAQMRLDTPDGQVGLSIEGKGNLAYSFDGRIAAVSRRLTPGDCLIEGPRAVFSVSTKDEAPSFRGPLRATRIACDGVTLAQPEFALRATLKPGLDGWHGETGIRAARLSSGSNRLATVNGRIAFNGDADQTRGTADLTAASVAAGAYRAGRSRIEGRYAFSPNSRNVSLLADISAASLDAGGAAQLDDVADMLASADGTPVDPIGDALAAAVRRAGREVDASASIRFVRGGNYQALRIKRLDAASRSGARLTLRGEDGLTYYWPSRTMRLDADLALAGGGFPEMRFNLSQPRGSAELSGVGGIAPMAAGAARLVLSPIRFVAGAGGRTRVETTALISGPFNDGRVDDLLIPVRGAFAGGGFAFGETCTTVSFRSLRAAGLTLGPTRLPLCPTGRALVWRNPRGVLQAAASVRAPRLTGRLGRTPISFAADQVRFTLAEPGFTSSGVAIRLGGGESVNRLDLASLSGRFNARGVIGRFDGGSGKLANVPLLLSNMAGDWSVQRGDLAINGGMTVADEQDPSRFHPLVSNDFRLTLRDNVIDAAGWLNDPETGTQVTRATITHALATSRGR
jgi:translocation and assembly module TamB